LLGKSIPFNLAEQSGDWNFKSVGKEM